MYNPAARKGDTDDKGFTIVGAVADTVTINGQPAAVQGSTMNDGQTIVGGLVSGVTINGKPAAVKTSTTTAHPIVGPGTINTGADTVTIG